MSEIVDECSAHGAVRGAVVPRVGQTANANQAAVHVTGHAWVEFATAADSVRATAALHGRLFGGSRVQCAFYSEAAFRKKIFS